MPGDRILVIDPSSAVQEIVKNTLAEAGYKVRTASNGMSALVSPEIEHYDLVILDAGMEGVDGRTATRELKTDSATWRMLSLLMFDEELLENQSDPALKGANGYIVKPFDPRSLLEKVQALFEERDLNRKAREYMDEAANKLMQQLADEHILKAVENKTQIIVERAIQNVVSTIDQRATVEVDQRVTQLTAEKEQELVRMTVHEVAKSMVEKLAERKVQEAIETILRDVTEKTVKRSVDRSLPGWVRERIKESLEAILPREVDQKTHQAIQQAIPELFAELSKKFDTVALKVVQRVAREKLPELIDKQLNISVNAAVPKLVKTYAQSELSELAQNYVQPEVAAARKKLSALYLLSFGVNLLLIGVLCAALYFGWLPVSR